MRIALAEERRRSSRRWPKIPPDLPAGRARPPRAGRVERQAPGRLPRGRAVAAALPDGRGPPRGAQASASGHRAADDDAAILQWGGKRNAWPSIRCRKSWIAAIHAARERLGRVESLVAAASRGDGLWCKRLRATPDEARDPDDEAAVAGYEAPRRSRRRRRRRRTGGIAGRRAAHPPSSPRPGGASGAGAAPAPPRGVPRAVRRADSSAPMPSSSPRTRRGWRVDSRRVAAAGKLGLAPAVEQPGLAPVEEPEGHYRAEWTWPEPRLADQCILAVCPEPARRAGRSGATAGPLARVDLRATSGPPAASSGSIPVEKGWEGSTRGRVGRRRRGLSEVRQPAAGAGHDRSRSRWKWTRLFSCIIRKRQNHVSRTLYAIDQPPEQGLLPVPAGPVVLDGGAAGQFVQPQVRRAGDGHQRLAAKHGHPRQRRRRHQGLDGRGRVRLPHRPAGQPDHRVGVARARWPAACWCSIADIGANPARIDTRTQYLPDEETGEILQVPCEVPVWVDPRAEGGTPMCHMLYLAHQVLADWIAQHPRSFPPIVVHITDGESQDGNPIPYADALKALATEDGNVLLFNCHLSMTAADPFMFPATRPGAARRVGPGAVPHVERAAGAVLPARGVGGFPVAAQRPGHGLQRRHGVPDPVPQHGDAGGAGTAVEGRQTMSEPCKAACQSRRLRRLPDRRVVASWRPALPAARSRRPRARHGR